MKQVLSIEQMQHLQELGLKLKPSLIHYYQIINVCSGKWYLSLTMGDIMSESPTYRYIPAYTLQDVLESLPAKLGVNGKIHITRDFMTAAWTVEYFEGATLGRVYFESEELIDAAYDMLCLLAKKGYVTKA